MNAFTPEQLVKLDWLDTKQPSNHPFKVRVTPAVVYNLETGEHVATVAPGYRFAWVHEHVHIVPQDWTVDEAEYEPKTQVAKAISSALIPLLGSRKQSIPEI